MAIVYRKVNHPLKRKCCDSIFEQNVCLCSGYYAEVEYSS